MDIVGLVKAGSIVPTSNAQTSRKEVAASTTSTTASPTTEVFYSSPIFRQDALTGALVEVWRDSKTGDQISQSPSRAALLYDKTQERGYSEANPSASSNGQTVSLRA